MSGDQVQLDWLVSEVVRRLRELAAAQDTPRAALTEPAPPVAPAPEPAAAASATRVASQRAEDLVLDARLVSLAVLAGRLAGVRRVLVPAGAVVTPSAKDLLRKERVQLEALPPRDASSAAENPIVIARWTRTAGAAQAAAALVEAAGTPAWAFETLEAAAQVILPALAEPQRRAVLLTDEPLLAVCRLNRAPVARAARVQDVVQLQEAVAAISLNCLVLDPRMCSAPMWHQLLAAYRDDSGSKNPPRELIPTEPTGG